MAAPTVEEIMEAIAAAAETTGIRSQVGDGPPSPPCLVVDFPDPIEWDATFGRGFDRFGFSPILLVSKASELASRKNVLKYLTADGDLSLRSALTVSNASPAPFGDVVSVCMVKRARDFGNYVFAGVEYFGVRIDLEIIARGR